MSENEKYVIRPNVKGEVESNKQVLPFTLLEGKQMILNAKRKTLAFTVLIWTAFSAYAYYTYVHKTPKEKTDEEIKETTVLTDCKESAEQVLPQFDPFASVHQDDTLKVTPENFFQICPSRNPRVVLNTKLDRFEVTETYYKYSREVQQIPLESVVKDDNGDYVFDERGYPIVRHHYLVQPVFDTMDKVRKLLTFF